MVRYGVEQWSGSMTVVALAAFNLVRRYAAARADDCNRVCGCGLSLLNPRWRSTMGVACVARVVPSTVGVKNTLQEILSIITFSRGPSATAGKATRDDIEQKGLGADPLTMKV